MALLIVLRSLVTIIALIAVRLMVEARPRYTLIIQQFLTSKLFFLYGGLVVITAKGDPIFVLLSSVILT